MRISDWSSDVCSSDLLGLKVALLDRGQCRIDNDELRGTFDNIGLDRLDLSDTDQRRGARLPQPQRMNRHHVEPDRQRQPLRFLGARVEVARRSEEHTSELQSLMRISYAVFCLKKKIRKEHNI